MFENFAAKLKKMREAKGEEENVTFKPFPEETEAKVKVEEKVEEPLVTVEIPTPVEVSEPQQVVTEIEEPKPTAKVTFLNRFMKKLGEFVDGVE